MSWSSETALILLATSEEGEHSETVVSAETENIAKGGIGMLCDHPVPLGTVVRCEIAVSNGLARIPTLLRVRWLDSVGAQKRYRMGLQFLI